MYYWFLLATWYHKDGTPAPDRRLISALQKGDPLAILYLIVAILVIAGPVIYRAVRKR